jgi:hypothetical protein
MQFHRVPLPPNLHPHKHMSDSSNTFINIYKLPMKSVKFWLPNGHAQTLTTRIKVIPKYTLYLAHNVD